MNTIPELLARLEDQHEHYTTVYGRRGQPTDRRTHAELTRRSRAMATRLLDLGFRPGEYVFLQLPNSMALIECVLGAVVANLVPCCLAPPRSLGGLAVFQERLRRLLAHFPNGHLLAHADVGDAAGFPYHTPPVVEDSDTPAPLHEVDPASTAFIQLTSGSTQHPKAVDISHRAVVSNVRGVCASARVATEDSMVSWLPFYHDMGLVGGLFCTLFQQFDFHVMQPETFLARPHLWLECISAIPGTSHSTAPNAAYQACVQRVPPEKVAELDLSRWKIAGCGAERVRSETLNAFAEHFAAAGFRKQALQPCYGLAEATLSVTFGAGDREPRVDQGHVSCGRPIPETEIVIRDSDGNPLPDGEQGEITVRSPSLCSGYAGGDAPTPIRDGWLYTGDRGYLRDGELYVTGRHKDLIIVDGVNHDPDEFESIGEDAVQVVGARSGAFAAEVEGREQVVLVNETTPQDRTVFERWDREIGERIASLFGFKVHDLLFVRRGCIQKTTSGKVARSKLRRMYENDQLDVLWRRKG